MPRPACRHRGQRCRRRYAAVRPAPGLRARHGGDHVHEAPHPLGSGWAMPRPPCRIDVAEAEQALASVTSVAEPLTSDAAASVTSAALDAAKQGDVGVWRASCTLALHQHGQERVAPRRRQGPAVTWAGRWPAAAALAATVITTTAGGSHGFGGATGRHDARLSAPAAHLAPQRPFSARGSRDEPPLPPPSPPADDLPAPEHQTLHLRWLCQDKLSPLEGVPPPEAAAQPATACCARGGGAAGAESVADELAGPVLSPPIRYPRGAPPHACRTGGASFRSTTRAAAAAA